MININKGTARMTTRNHVLLGHVEKLKHPLVLLKKDRDQMANDVGKLNFVP